ncbi:MAG: hypothetical protein JOY62_18710 [Acidobacteriaceae bacterium]|nr:hypothetical protein [Acidobacteriaceae bacterium]MBV9782000.1 hypothetical protein [Acidobacteriaceae bacterium]
MTDIDREHPDYKRHKLMWRSYRDLYAGGQQFKYRAAEYLLRRQKEPLDVYSERLQRVFYENYIGSIVDWYSATLFRRAPSLQFYGGNEAGQSFLATLADDCDLRGTSLTEFFKRTFTDTLIAGRSHILIDFPRAARPPANRAEEDAGGLSRAYLVRYSAEDLINWSLDGRGEFEWIVLKQTIERQLSPESPELVQETYWYYFDKTEYRTYKNIEQANPGSTFPLLEGIGTSKPAKIDLIAHGSHGLARQRRVPLLTMQVSDGLWLMNKAAQLQLEHFNKSNALGWAIGMGLFAMPVIYSDREWNQIVGESYYIQLGPQDRFGWTEPEGKVYQIAAQNLETLKEEMYRVCYLAQASGEMVGGHAQSAASKQLDFTITKEVLRGYGDMVKDTIKKVITAVSDAREDGLVVSVSGLDELDIGDFGTELQEATNLLQLGIKSPTLKRQIFQRLAFKFLSDLRQETKDQIAEEINTQT